MARSVVETMILSGAGSNESGAEVFSHRIMTAQLSLVQFASRQDQKATLGRHYFEYIRHNC